MAKYKQVAQLLESRDGKLQVELDNSSLEYLFKLIKAHAEKHGIKNMTVDDIRAAQKLKWDDPNHLPRIKLFIFDPGDKAPDFIKGNISAKLEE